MVSQILLAVFLAASIYVGFLYLGNLRKSAPEPSDSIEQFEMPAPAPIITQPLPEEPRTIAPGGPNTPNQLSPPSNPPVRLPGPVASDPFGDDYGSSDLKDNMRYPERLFGPAPAPKDTEIAVAAGIAGGAQQVTSQALQTFSPDFAQNGGEFIGGGIFANDTFSNPNYSAI